jgi:hypothetical protein
MVRSALERGGEAGETACPAIARAREPEEEANRRFEDDEDPSDHVARADSTERLRLHTEGGWNRRSETRRLWAEGVR